MASKEAREVKSFRTGAGIIIALSALLLIVFNIVYDKGEEGIGMAVILFAMATMLFSTQKESTLRLPSISTTKGKVLLGIAATAVVAGIAVMIIAL